MSPYPDRIIVVDNGSGDGFAEELLALARERLGEQLVISCSPAEAIRSPKADGEETMGQSGPHFLHLSLGENRGYAGAVNAAVKMALVQWAPDFFLILNSDVETRPDALAAFLDCAAAKPDTGIFGATIIAGDSLKLECAGGCRYLHWATITLPCLSGMTTEQAMKKSEPKLDFIHGACMFVRGEVFRAVGLFDEQFFLYCEELDFCLRAQRFGFDLGWCRNAFVAHAGGAALRAGFPNERERRLLANYHENLGALLIARKWSGAMFPLAVAWRFFGKLAVLVFRRETFLISALSKSFRQFFFGRSR